MEHPWSQVGFFTNILIVCHFKATLILCWSKRLLVQAVSMTGCDLSSSSKPWGVQEKTTKVVYQEFHEQVFMQIFLQHCQISRVVNFPGSFFNFPEIAFILNLELGTYYSKYHKKGQSFIIIYSLQTLCASSYYDRQRLEFVKQILGCPRPNHQSCIWGIPRTSIDFYPHR